MGIVKAFLRRESRKDAGRGGHALPVLLIFCRKPVRISIKDLFKSLFLLSFFFSISGFWTQESCCSPIELFFESRVSSYRRTSLELDQVALSPAVDCFERTRSGSWRKRRVMNRHGSLTWSRRNPSRLVLWLEAVDPIHLFQLRIYCVMNGLRAIT